MSGALQIKVAFGAWVVIVDVYLAIITPIITSIAIPRPVGWDNTVVTAASVSTR
jgi:hypothetical protein